ncbi:hypothetical protein UlMin_039536 [Ulmus minor]
MRSTLGYNSPNRDSSSKLSSPTLSSAVGERIRDQIAQGNIFTSTQTQTQTQTQTLEHHHISFQPNREPTHKPKRDSDQNPDPVAAPAASVVETPTTQIAGGSNFKTIAPPIREATVNAAGSSPVRYRECVKNHAAITGGHVLDGCGEFMPSGEEGSPEALKCAACECHRSFHRKEIAGVSKYPPIRDTSRRNSSLQHYLPPAPPSLHQHHHHHHHPPHRQFSIHGLSTSPIPAGPFPPVMMAFGGSHGAAAESSSEDLNVFQSNYGGKPSFQQQPSSKKRFRTKFTPEQKDKMMEFAEKLGWRIQKHDEQEVQSFCSEVGVKRPVFKVWMHNNKQAMKKKEGEV